MTAAVMIWFAVQVFSVGRKKQESRGIYLFKCTRSDSLRQGVILRSFSCIHLFHRSVLESAIYNRCTKFVIEMLLINMLCLTILAVCLKVKPFACQKLVQAMEARSCAAETWRYAVSSTCKGDIQVFPPARNYRKSQHSNSVGPCGWHITVAGLSSICDKTIR